MLKFIKALLLFLFPFILMLINYQNFSASGGDLNRLGKVSVDKNYRDKFAPELNRKQVSKNLSEIDLLKTDTVDILTIGDSFSQFKGSGYQNYLAINHKQSVVNMDDNYTVENPIQMLISLSNGDFFDSLKVKNIVLESVERNIVLYAINLKLNDTINLKKLQNKYLKKPKTVSQNDGFSEFLHVINYNLYNVLYNFDTKAYFSKSYRVPLNNKNLFSNSNNELIFFEDDISKIEFSTAENIQNLNSVLNDLTLKLKKKGIRLIVMPCADKYGMYCDYISNNKLPKNIFFEYNLKLQKKYLYIDSKEVLLSNIKAGVKDVYYADDTHWSYLSAKVIANNIFEKIKNQSK